MQIYLLLFIALFALVDGHRGKKSRVIELTDTTFDTLVGKGEWVVELCVEFCHVLVPALRLTRSIILAMPLGAEPVLGLPLNMRPSRDICIMSFLM